jgi:hypothetical protein
MAVYIICRVTSAVRVDQDISDSIHIQISRSDASFRYDNIKTDLKGIGYEGVNWIHLIRGRVQC